MYDMYLQFQYNDNVSDVDLLDVRGVDYVKLTLQEIAALLNCDSVSEAADAIIDKMQALNMSVKLSDLSGGIDEHVQEVIVRHGFNKGRINNNPRRMTEKGLRGILSKIQ